MFDAADDARTGQTPRWDVVMLVDEDVARDKRVLAALAEYSGVEVIDCAGKELASSIFSIFAYLKGLKFLIVAALHGAGIWRLLHRQYGLQAKEWIAGVHASLRGFVRAHQVAANLRSRMDGVRLIHAHDLFCGIIGAELSRLTGADMVYDAHEVEFHRNRKNSWLRTAYDVTVEKRVVDCAREVRVINAPIAALYERIHDIPFSRIRVVLNNHFASHLRDVAADVPSADHLAFVYVGGGVRGRQLDELAGGASRLGVAVHGFFINEVPDLAVANRWIIGCRDYEDDLISLVASHRCMMWCCVDDVCLSYRLSLPNKFFQALAVGIPVIAAHGTYLAQIVERFQLGVVFNGGNLLAIVEQMRSPVFEEWVAHVQSFRTKLHSGNVVI